MNTKAGARKTRQTMIVKYGSEDAWKEYMRKIASIGGRKGTADGTIKGFALDRERARVAGARGGRKSRRGKAVKHVDVEYKPTFSEVDVKQNSKSWVRRLFS